MELLLITFGLPLLIFFIPVRGVIGKSLLLRFAVSVIAVCLAMDLLHTLVWRPMAMRSAEARGDYEYDGTGAGAAMIFIGGVGGIIGSITALIVFRLTRWIRKRRTQAGLPPTTKVPPAPADPGRESDPYATPMARDDSPPRPD